MEKQIRDILLESNCPNESFENTFEDCEFFPRSNLLRIGNGDIETVLDVETK